MVKRLDFNKMHLYVSIRSDVRSVYVTTILRRRYSHTITVVTMTIVIVNKLLSTNAQSSCIFPALCTKHNHLLSHATPTMHGFLLYIIVSSLIKHAYSEPATGLGILC